MDAIDGPTPPGSHDAAEHPGGTDSAPAADGVAAGLFQTIKRPQKRERIMTNTIPPASELIDASRRHSTSRKRRDELKELAHGQTLDRMIADGGLDAWLRSRGPAGVVAADMAKRAGRRPLPRLVRLYALDELDRSNGSTAIDQPRMIGSSHF